jgi:hypothetical protein
MGAVTTEPTSFSGRSARASTSPSRAQDLSARDPRRPWAPSPFTRLARAHAASVAGDALFAIGLAGSVFFSLDFTAARWRVALYLILTIAPFAIAAPLIGPVLDRMKGGRRWIIVGSIAMRAILAFFVVRHMNSLLFYPEAFGMLVMQKVYSISKSAFVPGTVHTDEELVEANSKLTVLSSIAVVVVALPGGLLLKLGGGAWSVGLGGIIFAVGTVLALQLPPTTIAVAPAGELEQEELRSAGITHASAAMGLIRGIVGFLSFMLAFDFKAAGLPLWQLGLVAATAQFGFFIGAVIAPRLRRVLVEERILIGSLLLMMVGGFVTFFIGGLGGAAILSMLVGATGSAAKQAFDSIVQRDAPDANRGRSFAKFETRFQLIWVVGALAPIIIPIPSAVGFGLIAIVAAIAVTTYLVGLRNLRRGRLPIPRKGILRRPVVIDERHPSVRPATDPTRVADLGFAAVDPTLPGVPPTAGDPIDPTLAGGHAPLDPARRWMSGPPAPAPQPPTDPGAPVHRHDGIIFGPDAWDEDGPPESGS